MTRYRPTRNDYSLAWLRIAVGVLFLIFAQYKILGTAFAHGEFQDSIHQFIRNGAYPFMVPILRLFVLAHAPVVAYVIGYGELCIGLGLVLGVFVRAASCFGLLYMIALLLSSNYPGPRATIPQYFGAALNHLVFALCFVAFGMGDTTRVWSVPSYYRRKFARQGQEAEQDSSSNFIASNVFGK